MDYNDNHGKSISTMKRVSCEICCSLISFKECNSGQGLSADKCSSKMNKTKHLRNAKSDHCLDHKFKIQS